MRHRSPFAPNVYTSASVPSSGPDAAGICVVMSARRASRRPYRAGIARPARSGSPLSSAQWPTFNHNTRSQFITTGGPKMGSLDSSLHQASSVTSTPADPPVGGFVVTPSDSAQLNNGTTSVIGRAVSVGTVGTLKVTYKDGTTSTIPAANLIAGAQTPMQVTHIWSTGTTATDIYVWY